MHPTIVDAIQDTINELMEHNEKLKTENGRLEQENDELWAKVRELEIVLGSLKDYQSEEG